MKHLKERKVRALAEILRGFTWLAWLAWFLRGSFQACGEMRRLILYGRDVLPFALLMRFMYYYVLLCNCMSVDALFV